MKKGAAAHTEDRRVVVRGDVLSALDLDVAIEGVQADLKEEADGLVHRWGNVGVGILEAGYALLTLVVVAVDGSSTVAVGMTI